MEIDVMQYLSEGEIKEMVRDELRSVIRTKLNSDSEVARIIGNASYYKVYGILDDQLPDGWENTVTTKIDELLENPSSYSVFRYDYYSGKPTSKASVLLEKAVEDNNDRIVNSVNKLLDKFLNENDENYERFIEMLSNKMYNGFNLKFERGI